MGEENYWRVRCSTEGSYVYAWGTSKPTECQNDSGHTIVSGDTVSEGIRQNPEFVESTIVIEGEMSIPSTNWSELGALVTNVAGLIPDISQAVGRVVGEIQTDGTAEIRVREDGTTSLHSTVYQHGDTSSAWEDLATSTDTAPTSGQKRYTIEGRLVGATSAKVRDVALSLLRSYS
jgi:hypothetical protein